MGPIAEGRDHYKTLGLERGATDVEIRRAYRAAAKASHPDHHPGPGFAERFRAAQVAYEVLADPNRRARYDAILQPRPAGPTAERRPGYTGGPRPGGPQRSGSTGRPPTGETGSGAPKPPPRPGRAESRPPPQGATDPTPPRREPRVPPAAPRPASAASSDGEETWKKVLGAVCALLLWWGWGHLGLAEPAPSTVLPDVEISVLPESDLERFPSAPAGDPYDLGSFEDLEDPYGDGLGGSGSISSPGSNERGPSFGEGRDLGGDVADEAPHYPSQTQSLMDDDEWGLGSCTTLFGDVAYPDQCQGPDDGPRVTAWAPSASSCTDDGWVDADPGAWCISADGP